MQGFHIPAAPPLYTNTFLLISDAGHAVVIDPAAEVHSYDEILKQHNATLTTILCTHGHYDHVGSAAALKAEWNVTALAVLRRAVKIVFTISHSTSHPSLFPLNDG